jgi:hypothetical protein
MTVVRHIPSVMKFDATWVNKLAKIDGYARVAESKLLILNDIYRSPKTVAGLLSCVCVAYKQVCLLVVYRLPQPVISASCERAWCKLDVVTSAVR